MSALPMPRPETAHRMAVARVTAADSPVVRLDFLTWQELAQELTQHRPGRKDGPGWMPAEIQPGPRKGDRVRHVSALALDVEAQAERLQDGTKRLTGPTPPPLSAMASELDLWGLAAVLATSHSHLEPAAGGGTVGPRYRVTIKLSRPIAAQEVRPLALYVAARLGVSESVDTSCMEPARLFYLPRCPADRMRLAESATVEGEPLDVDEALRAARATSKPRAVSQVQSASVIDAFNAAHDLPALLARHGYKEAGRHRWTWPGSTTGMPGVVYFPEAGRVYSHHAADPLHDPDHSRDAFDAWCALEHAGDLRAATREAARILGMGKAPQTAKPAAEAPASAPQPLPAELLPVDPFPLDALPDAFRPWVADVTELMQCPPDFVAVPLLVAAASLVARHVGVRPQRRTDWQPSGNLWALIVGRPGRMKSPAMSRALAPIYRLEKAGADAFKDRAALYEAEALAAKLRTDVNIAAAKAALKKDSGASVADLLQEADREDMPTRRRYVVADATYEKLGEVLAENPAGVLSVRDEMRGLFLHLGREDNAQALGFYLQAWSGGSYTFDRIQRGTVTIEDLRLSMIGGIQPGPLSDLMLQARRGAADVGMVERFLIAWPDLPSDWREVDRDPDSEAKRRVWDAFERLDTITPNGLEAEADPSGHGLPFLRLDEDAREAFSEWRHELERSMRNVEAEGLEGALSKFKHHVPALALALHVIDGGTGPVTLQATLRALTLAEYFESHARRLHGSGRRVTVRCAAAILAKVKAGALPATFTARDVYRNDWSGMTDPKAVAEALDMLAAYRWLVEATTETGGRPMVTYTLSEGARCG